jgi:hypothetical protein
MVPDGLADSISRGRSETEHPPDDVFESVDCFGPFIGSNPVVSKTSRRPSAEPGRESPSCLKVTTNHRLQPEKIKKSLLTNARHGATTKKHWC